MDNARNEVYRVSVDSRLGIFWSASETNDGLFLLPITGKIIDWKITEKSGLGCLPYGSMVLSMVGKIIGSYLYSYLFL